jgi:hypothetical protein
VPGAGLLRDSQKWVAPLVVLEALVIGTAIDRAVTVARERAQAAWTIAAVVLAAALPILVLPDAPATLRTPLRPVTYPADWAAVSQVLARHPVGDVLVLPFSAYRTFAWAPGRTVLDPAPRLLPLPAVVDDQLAVGHTVLRGENPLVRKVAAALHRTSADPATPAASIAPATSSALARTLTGLRIAWIVVEHGTPGTLPALPQSWTARPGADVSLYRVPGHIAADVRSTAATVAVLAGDVLAALAVLGCAGGALVRNRRRHGKSTTAS